MNLVYHTIRTVPQYFYRNKLCVYLPILCAIWTKDIWNGTLPFKAWPFRDWLFPRRVLIRFILGYLIYRLFIQIVYLFESFGRLLDTGAQKPDLRGAGCGRCGGLAFTGNSKFIGEASSPLTLRHLINSRIMNTCASMKVLYIFFKGSCTFRLSRYWQKSLSNFGTILSNPCINGVRLTSFNPALNPHCRRGH